MSKKIIIIFSIIVVIVFGLFLFSEEPEIEIEKESYNISSNYTVTGPVKEKGDRLFGIMPYPSEEGDDSSVFNILKSAGVNTVVLGYGWPEVEIRPGVFDFSTIDKQNSVYKDIKVTLMLNPIETDSKAVPIDLENVPFDDPVMIERFKVFMTKTFDHLSDLNIETVLFGNEVNGYLYDFNKWDEYTTFYEAVGAHAKTLRPGIKIGTEVMFEGLIEGKGRLGVVGYPDKIKRLNRVSDIFALTYSPADPNNMVHSTLEFFEKDIADLTSTYSDKKIHIIEITYTSSPILKSSEEEQAQFIVETFKIWDKYEDQIELLNFFMLHDYDKKFIEPLFTLLGLDEHPQHDELLEAFTTLGLRTFHGKGADKLAFIVLKEEAKARGWR